MDVLIVVDMQVGLLTGQPKYDLPHVIDRLNALAKKTRERAGLVVWIQHVGEGYASGSPQSAFLPEMDRQSSDVVVQKSLNDPFVGTHLSDMLEMARPDNLLIGGWATDFCVDATVRSAVSRDYNVRPVSDCHTLSDRPHLDASAVIAHHNWVWNNLIAKRPVQIVTTVEWIG